MSDPGDLTQLLAQLRTSTARARQASAAYVQQAREIRESAARERLRTRSERDEALRTLQTRARSGELGEQMRRIAVRVDEGDASWADVFRARDTSPEALALRETVGRAGEEWRRSHAAPDAPEGDAAGPPDPSVRGR
ncbi:hypothetical protein [Nocardioides sp.]|uniref:hypothetical protein n=1 Tax=Nocardioides sp. TaxID=35761 RepID=UPI0035112673